MIYGFTAFKMIYFKKEKNTLSIGKLEKKTGNFMLYTISTIMEAP